MRQLSVFILSIGEKQKVDIVCEIEHIDEVAKVGTFRLEHAVRNNA